MGLRDSERIAKILVIERRQTSSSLRAGKVVERIARARRLQDNRRRQDLDQIMKGADNASNSWSRISMSAQDSKKLCSPACGIFAQGLDVRSGGENSTAP